MAEDLHLLHEEEDEQCTNFNIFPEFFSELKNKYINMKLLQWRAKINNHLSTNHQDLRESSKNIHGCKTLNTHILLNNAPIHTIFRSESPGEQDLPEYIHEFEN
jgi:hypothetical protein